ncbi:MAG: S8 family peptidase [Pseudomonadota bacterium]
MKTKGIFARGRLATALILGTLLASPVSMAGGSDPATTSTTLAESPPTNQFIVKYKSLAVSQSPIGATIASGNTGDQARVLSQAMGMQVTLKRRAASGAAVYRIAQWRKPAELKLMLAKIQADPNVEYAEPDLLLQPMATPNDARYNEQWHYFEPTGGLNLPLAWDSTTGAGTVVAVIDTGYRAHPDLAGNLLPGYDMISDTFVSVDGDGRDSDATDPGDFSTPGQCGPGQPARSSSWHGTHVAGTVAAVTNNGTGVAGVAYGAKVVPLRALGRCGGYTSDIADSIIWASGGSVAGTPTNANPADVINMSLGGGGACSTTTQSAINIARANGATIVVAAGNSNQNASAFNPANCSGVITVASTNRNGGRAYYSNFGADVDVAAPGGDVRASAANGVLSTLNSGGTTPGSNNYAFYQGTSMAAPHVAGLAAMLKALDSSLTPDQIESTITSTARAFPATCSQCGAGIADAAAAVATLTGGGGGGGGSEPVLENGVPETGLAASTGSELRFTIEVPAGASNLSFQIAGGSGDADLYVRFGAAPTTSTYDCRPYLNGNNETCDISNVQEGTYHVLVRAWSTFSGVTLTASFDEPSSGGGAEGGSAGLNNLSASRRNWLRYTVDIPPGMSTFQVQISGGSGDADLYLRFGNQPLTSRYDCRPYLNGNNEVCTITNPQAGTWHIGIRAYQTFSGVDLSAQWSP